MSPAAFRSRRFRPARSTLCARLGVGARLRRLALISALALEARAGRLGAQSFSPEFQINSYTPFDQLNPRIAHNSAGDFVVVWYSNVQDGSYFGVFGQRYGSAGAALGGEFRVNTYTTKSQSSPSVACNSAGTFIVVWMSYTQDGSGYGVFGQRYGSGGAPLGGEFPINTYTTSYQVFPSVAIDSAGNFTVVWQSYGQDGSATGVFGQRYGSTGAPLAAEFRVNTYTTNEQMRPSIAIDSTGTFVVVWSSKAQDGSEDGVFGQRFGGGGAPLGEEFRANAYTTNAQRLPSVSTDSAGNFVVVWQSYTQDWSGWGVFAQRYADTGAPAGGEFRVNTYVFDQQYYPSVACDTAGSFVVAWQSNTQDGSLNGVFGQAFGSTGTALGSEFRVNTYTTNNQRFASVETSSPGQFVVVWQSYAQDGSSWGVFGQRFCPLLASVTIGVSGSTSVCTTSTGGTATVTDSGGSTASHQWGFRTTPGGLFTNAIFGQTGISYVIKGADFPSAGSYYLVCATFPDCGTAMFSNELTIMVASDVTSPVVTPPSALTTTQTLCQ